MSEMNINAIRSLYDAYRRKDIPAIFEVFDAEIEIYQTELLPWGGDYRGQHEARNFVAKLTQHIDFSRRRKALYRC